MTVVLTPAADIDHLAILHTPRPTCRAIMPNSRRIGLPVSAAHDAHVLSPFASLWHRGIRVGSLISFSNAHND